MKIISITGLALLLPLSFSANALAWLPGHFVAGAELGYVTRTGNVTSDDFSLAGVPIPGSNSQDLNNGGTLYGAFAGYQVVCQKYIFGIEGFLDFGDDNHVKSFPIPLLNITANGNLSTQRDTTYGVSARIGYIVHPCLVPYIRVGTQGGNDKFFLTYAGLPPLPIWDAFEDEGVHWSWLLGIGLEVPLFSKKSSIRVEYDYSPSPTIRYADFDLPVFAEHHYKAHSHAVKVQWVWNFI